MERANPVDMRKTLELVNQYRMAGIPFVPVPVFDEEDRARTVALAAQKLEIMARAAEKEEGA